MSRYNKNKGKTVCVHGSKKKIENRKSMLRAKGLIRPVHVNLFNRDDMYSVMYKPDERLTSGEKANLGKYANGTAFYVSVVKRLLPNMSSTKELQSWKMKAEKATIGYCPSFLREEFPSGTNACIQLGMLAAIADMCSLLDENENRDSYGYTDTLILCRTEMRKILEKCNWTALWGSTTAANTLDVAPHSAALISFDIANSYTTGSALVATRMLMWAMCSGIWKLDEASRDLFYLMLYYLGDITATYGDGDIGGADPIPFGKEFLGRRINTVLTCDWIIDTFCDTNDKDMIMQLADCVLDLADVDFMARERPRRFEDKSLQPEIHNVEEFRDYMHTLVHEVLCGEGTEEDVRKWLVAYLKNYAIKKPFFYADCKEIDYRFWSIIKSCDKLVGFDTYAPDETETHHLYYIGLMTAHEGYNSLYTFITSVYDYIPMFKEDIQNAEKLHDLNEEVLKLRKDTRSLRSEATEHCRQIKSLTKENETLKSEMGTVEMIPKSDYEILQKKLNDLKHEIEITKSTNCKYKNRIDTLQTQISELENENSRLSIFSENADAMQSLEEYVGDLEKQLNELEDETSTEWDINNPSEEDRKIMQERKFLFYIPQHIGRLKQLERYFPNCVIDYMPAHDSTPPRRKPTNNYDCIIACVSAATHGTTYHMKHTLGSDSNLLYTTLSNRLETIAFEAIRHYKRLNSEN